MFGAMFMNLVINGEDYTIDAKSNPFTVGNLLDYLEIKSMAGLAVEKNGEVAEKFDEVVDGDNIQITRFIGGG
jgi:thiamine biosynthesis protein ThiS